MGKWKTYENPKDHQTRQDMVWGLDLISKKKKEKNDCSMGRVKCQTASSTPQQRNLRGIDRWQRLRQGDCWRPSGAGKRHRSCCAVRWEEWQPSGTSVNCNFNWCQWGTIRLWKYRSMRQGEATTFWTTSTTKICGKLPHWPGTQASFCSRSSEDASSQRRRG